MLTNPAVLAASIFVLSYVLIVARAARPILLVFIAGALLLLTGTITPLDALSSINYNVLGIFWGTMVLAELFIASRAPDYLAGRVVARVRTAGLALVAVSAFSGFISSFVDNVATVLIVAPIAFDIAHRLKISPTPFLIGIAISSNLQGTATMIGDSTSIILATTANMNFMDFFFLQGKPSIFFAVELGAVAATLMLWFIFRRMRQPINLRQASVVLTWTPTWLLVLLVLTLAGVGFIPNKPAYTIGLITLVYGVIGLIWNSLWGKLPINLLKLDWETFFFLVGIFVLVGSLSVTGIVDMLASGITRITGGNAFVAFMVLVWFSVVVSAFVDNIPYTIAMLPVAQQVAVSLGTSPFLLMFGLLVGTSLGGNITPIGASANVVAVGMLRKRGYNVSFGEFVSVGLPFTLAAVGSAALFLWLVWA